MNIKLTSAFASAAMALAMSVAGGSIAHASTYLLNVDNCSSGCGSTSYGTINVTGEGTATLNVDIELNSNVIFMPAGGGANGHEDVWFNLNEASTTIGGLSAPFVTNGLQAAGSYDANGNSFGTWDYIVEYKPGVGVPSDASGGIHSLLFTLTGTAPAFQFNTVGANDLYFVVDVAAFTADGVKTGRVGATLCDAAPCGHEGGGGGGVPEPATWAMMLVGFGGMGAVLRRNRRQATFA